MPSMVLFMIAAAGIWASKASLKFTEFIKLARSSSCWFCSVTKALSWASNSSRFWPTGSAEPRGCPKKSGSVGRGATLA
eukprot:14018795-Alexandrium_andersonii.AAC.1